MANHSIDDFDPAPKVRVRVAQTDEENREALKAFALFKMQQGGKWDNWSNDDFIALCEEPEFLVDCTPLERELIIRLSTAWEMAKDPDYGLH